jgi:hypothetical protein
MPSEAAQSTLLIDRLCSFYSQTDEDHFFAWLQSIPSIKGVKGVGRGLEVIVKRPIDKESLRDLIALMTRYGLDCRPLKPLCDEQPDEYFRTEGKFWYSAVYGLPKSTE